MARIEFPARGLGEHADWALLRPGMASGIGALSEAVYGTSELPWREREAARWMIAQLNECPVCQGTRARQSSPDDDDGFYAEVMDWRMSQALSERERLAAEFAQRFALDHLAMDDEFWGRLRAAFADDEIVDLTICCGAFLGMGRMVAVMGVPAPEEGLRV